MRTQLDRTTDEAFAKRMAFAEAIRGLYATAHKEGRLTVPLEEAMKTANLLERVPVGTLQVRLTDGRMRPGLFLTMMTNEGLRSDDVISVWTLLYS